MKTLVYGAPPDETGVTDVNDPIVGRNFAISRCDSPEAGHGK
jgi:hypothetical protein